MKINELIVGQQIIVQILWSEQKIEFYSDILEIRDEGIITTPYIHNDLALDLNIETHSGVICNIFADNPYNKSRISWKNVRVETITSDNSTTYFINTSTFNRLSHLDDNRRHDRVLVSKSAHILDKEADKLIDIRVHDISDYGISFYAPASYKPSSNQLTIVYSDSIDEKDFQLKLECKIARTEIKAGTVFYGCKILGENKEYHLYGFLKRLRRRHSDNNSLNEN